MSKSEKLRVKMSINFKIGEEVADYLLDVLHKHWSSLDTQGLEVEDHSFSLDIPAKLSVYHSSKNPHPLLINKDFSDTERPASFEGTITVRRGENSIEAAPDSFYWRFNSKYLLEYMTMKMPKIVKDSMLNVEMSHQLTLSD